MVPEAPLERGDNTEGHELPTKKPYMKPEFRFEQVFVTSALSCGKADHHSGACNRHPMVS